MPTVLAVSDGCVLAVTACIYTGLMSYWTRQDDRFHTTTLERIIPYFMHWVVMLGLLTLPQWSDFVSVSIAHPVCYTTSMLFFTVVMGLFTFTTIRSDVEQRVPHAYASDSYLFYILVMVNYPLFLCGYCLTMQTCLTATVSAVIFGGTLITATVAMASRGWYARTRKRSQS